MTLAELHAKTSSSKKLKIVDSLEMNDEQQKQQQRRQSVQQKMKMEMGLNDGMQQPMINLHSKRKQVISCMKMYFNVAFQ